MKLPQLNCKYGAPLGRSGKLPADTKAPIKLHLVRVRLDSGGYDRGGAYWGLGRPLYWATDTDADSYTVDVFLRADNRAAAKAEVQRQIPGARFFR